MGYSITKHLSSRIIIVLLPVILGVILSCIFVFYFMGKINIERNAFQALDMKALAFKAQVENWDQLMCRIGKGITYNNHVQNLNSQITTEVLKATFQANKDYISTCFLFDFQGYVSAMGHSTIPDTQSRGNRNYFRSAMAGAAVARESIFSMSTKKPAVAFAFPVYTPLGLTDKPQAVIAIVTNLSNLSQLAIQNKVGKTGISFVVDDQGIVLGHPDEKLVSGDKLSSLSDYPPVKAALAGHIGAMEFKDSSQQELFSISSRLSNGWYTVVTQQKTEVFAGMGELTTAVIAAGTSIILILILFLFFVINHATKPLILLSMLIEEMGKGNFLATSKVNIKKLSKRKDEMGIMARAVSKLETYMSDKQKILETIARGAGDFTIQVDVASEADLFSLKLQEMLNSLNCIILDVKRSAQEINKGSQQISQATQLLSQGTTQQAAAMEEITATTSEILGQTKQNAQDAEHAQEFSQQNQAIAKQSSVSAKTLNEAMQGISQSSDQIQKIMKLISDIAFQTNLLSLNASIEAAKAGKYGRGFNVVAQEVRDLARKSSEAVNNTSQVIEESVSRTAQGDQEVKKVLQQLNSMVEKTQQVADKVQQIAAASIKQTSSIQEINQGLDQISQVTQNTTASTEEISSNAQELAQQAQMLLELVEQFHLKE